MALTVLLAGCHYDLEDQPGRVVDDTFAQLNQGQLEEAGARGLISAGGSGSVRIKGRLDVNGDGHVDLVLTNNGVQGQRQINSYVYLGSAKGVSASSRIELPATGPSSAVLADLNHDGQVDLALAGFWDSDNSPRVNSYIYWGDGKSFDPARRQLLPALGAHCVATADLNRDGRLDLVLANLYQRTGVRPNSYIYWGAAGGFSTTNRAELPTLAGAGLAIADLDHDGHLDLLFGNQQDGPSIKVNSYIYWGAASGFSTQRRSELPTEGVTDCTVADLDHDGELDLVFSSGADIKNLQTNSLIYWGRGPRQYSAGARTILPSLGAAGVSVADLDRDGELDVVLANTGKYPTQQVNSYIYWGRLRPGAKPGPPAELPGDAARGVMLVDLDRDDHLDLVLANNNGKVSYVYLGPWTRAPGLVKRSPIKLPSHGASNLMMQDLGSVARRLRQVRFVSRALDSGRDAPRYGLLSWKATVPERTALGLELRSAGSAEGLKQAAWRGPDAGSTSYTKSPAQIPAGQRWIQYRATLSTRDFATTPVLDRVEISYR